MLHIQILKIMMNNLDFIEIIHHYFQYQKQQNLKKSMC